MSVAAEVRRGRLERVQLFFRPRTLTMLLLGFSSGLPFYLTGNTLGFWLRDEGTSLTAIGFLSWVGIAYSIKPLYAPVIDRSDLPLFGRLGRRRGWMLATQLTICFGLIAMSVIGPHGGLTLLGACALLVAFSSSTQDIVVDAWRIEVADNADELGLLSSAYQLGYRVAIIITESLILIAAGHWGWPISYSIMGALMAVGILATWKATEPRSADEAISARATALPLWTSRGFYDAVVGPFLVFFKSYGSMALLMLLMISLYRLPDFFRGPMMNPFYHDLGLSKDVIGGIRASVGLTFAFVGIAAGGLSSARFGYFKTLIAGAVVQALGIGAFSILALHGADIRIFGVIMAVDDFALGFAGVALVTYMSSLTSLGYTATQYALLSSAYVYLGKILKGTSGALVDSLSRHGHSLMSAYGIFFIISGAIGVPGIILCLVLARVQNRQPRPAG
jgi:PAT family beta-lactamase induction signal transducer AmpG